MAIIQVWSAPSCQAGAVCFGSVAPWVSATGSEATGTPAGFRVTVTRDVADAASLAEGRCLRVLSQSRGEQWWFVSSVADGDGDAGLVTVTAGPLRQLLTVRGLVRDAAVFRVDAGRLTPADAITTYVLTNLADDGLSWLSLGTMGYTDSVEVGVLDRVTRAGVLDLLEQRTGATAQLRAVYSSGVLTGFAIDLVTDPGATLPLVPLATGSNLATVQRTRDALRAASVVIPFDARRLPLEQTAWTISATSGTAPAWITLRDPIASAPWPIREDGQFVGAYLVQTDGTASIITNSRASDSAVEVGTIGTLATGAEVTLARDTAGRPVLELTSPANVAGPRGRLVASVQTSEPHGARNLVRNPLMLDWSAIDNPARWSQVGSCVVAEYFRDTPTTWTAVTDGITLAGAAGVFYRGATPNSRLYQSESVQVGAYASGILTSTASGTGTGSFLFSGASPIAADVPDGTAISLIAVTRPSAFPVERYQNTVMRFLSQPVTQNVSGVTTQQHMRSEAVRIATAVGTTVSVRAAWTCRNRTGAAIQNRDSGGLNTLDKASIVSLVLPGVMLYNNATNALLAWDVVRQVPATSTTSDTLTASATISADTTVRLGLFPGTQGRSDLFSACRWVSLWIGDDVSADDPWLGSRSNLVFHRAQDVLASAAQGTRYTVRGVDLARLQQETGALALGQWVRLRSELLGINATVRIVKLDYDFSGPESLNLELGAVTPRLTGVTVTL